MDMKTLSFKQLNGGLMLLIAIAAIARIVPHPLGVTPIGALGLFSGTHIKHRWALFVPVFALLLGDVVIGIYAAPVMAAVYFGFLTTVLVGRFILGTKRTPLRYCVAIITGAICFYLISNIGMWYIAFPRTLDGLIACYIQGLPFLLRTLGGDFIYSLLMFGGYEWLQQWQTKKTHGTGLM